MAHYAGRDGTARADASAARPRRARVAHASQADRILAVASDLFLAHGYTGVTIDAIVAAAGGSKRDLYLLFGDKRSLFEAVVMQLCREALRCFLAVPDVDDLEQGLLLIGRALLELLLSPRSLALHRLMVAEASHLPHTAAEFLRQGPFSAVAIVADFIQKRLEAGQMTSPDAASSARLFINAIAGDLQLRALMGRDIPPEDREALVRAVVDMFLLGHLPRPSRGSTPR